MQVFVSITVLGHFIAPGCLCLRLVGSRERAGLNTHSNTHDTHTNGKESTDPGIVSHSQNKLQKEKRFVSATVEADTKPDSSLSNGIDDVPQDFHLNTFLTHRKK